MYRSTYFNSNHGKTARFGFTANSLLIWRRRDTFLSFSANSQGHARVSGNCSLLYPCLIWQNIEGEKLTIDNPPVCTQQGIMIISCCQLIHPSSRFFIIGSNFTLPRWNRLSVCFTYIGFLPSIYYSFCAGNSLEARRDLNVATEILLANVTGESTLC